jgi:hypothetical protein
VKTWFQSSGFQYNLYRYIERAGVAIAEASIETHGDVVRNTFWPTAASAHRLLDAVPVLEVGLYTFNPVDPWLASA